MLDSRKLANEIMECEYQIELRQTVINQAEEMQRLQAENEKLEAKVKELEVNTKKSKTKKSKNEHKD